MTLVVEAVGPQALVQDDGRPGYAHLGVTRSGAADQGALRLGNRLAGNDPAAAGIEVLFGGLTLRATEPVTLALTGAVGPVHVDGRPAGHGQSVYLAASQELRIGTPVQGVRTYVCVHGGIAVDPVLGSRSTDTLADLGPEPLRVGTRLPLGAARGDPADVEAPGRLPGGSVTLAVRLGPRADWFTDDALTRLGTHAWRVSDRSDRVGTRLNGPELARRDERELPSEACVRGSVQVSSDGLPTVFGPDHPVTGGYPVIGVVDGADCDLLAQSVPGTPVRFRPR